MTYQQSVKGAISTFLRENKCSKEEFCNLVGMSPDELQRKCDGEEEFLFSEVIRIARALGKSVSDLVED